MDCIFDLFSSDIGGVGDDDCDVGVGGDNPI